MRRTIAAPEYDKLRRFLRKIRREAGLNQQQVAELLGEPQSFVSKYESGERRLDVLELREICVVLGMPFTDFAVQLEALLKEKNDAG